MGFMSCVMVVAVTVVVNKIPNQLAVLYILVLNLCKSLFGFKFWKFYWKLKPTLIIDKSNQQVLLFSLPFKLSFAEKVQIVAEREEIKTSKVSNMNNSHIAFIRYMYTEKFGQKAQKQM